jgi:DNA adenine methylase
VASVRSSAPSVPKLGSPYARPVLKWAGGKGRLVPRILVALPDQIRTYYEPFVGSAAVFFALASQKRFQNAVLGDQNPELINVYRALQSDVKGLIKALSKHRYDRDTYYAVRDLNPENLDPSERAARTIYLNKAGFNGLYRVNRSGQFNVPFGRHTNPTICDEPRLRRAAALLQSVTLQVADFATVCKAAKRKDAVYFDPPYVPLSKTSNFTAYHEKVFDDSEHERLAILFGRLVNKGVGVVLSNSDTPLTRKLYSEWKPQTLMVTRPINSKTTHRGGVAELLVSVRPLL